MALNEQQIQEVLDWMNKWDQLKHTVIPIRFREDFTPGMMPDWMFKPPDNVVEILRKEREERESKNVERKKIFTAKVARSKTDFARKTTEENFSLIESVSANGNDCVTIKTNEIRDPKQTRNDLEGLGFEVNDNGNWFDIKW